MKRDNMQLNGQIKLYILWPAVMAIILAMLDVWIYMIDYRAGVLLTLFLIVYVVVVLVMYLKNRALVMSDLVQFAAQYGKLQGQLLDEMDMPYVIVMDDGKIVWANKRFDGLMHTKAVGYLSQYIPDLNSGVFPKEEGSKKTLEIAHQKRIYKAEISNVPTHNFSGTGNIIALPESKQYFITVQLSDITELKRYIQENEEQKLVAGLIYIDNYDEVMDSVEEVRQSLLVALIDRKINQYVGKMDGIVKKLEKDKYFIVIKKKFFEKMKEDRFSILEDVKNVNIGNERPATLSIGLGLSAESYEQSNNYARVSIDLALARGGDQAVVKNNGEIDYYGGRREQTSKNTRVKARVKAEALREFITSKDKVIIMGHKIGDVDSFGAAIGLYRAATALEKTVHIVMNEITSSVRPLYDSFVENPNYPEDLFLTSRNVEDYVTDNTMVIVVDTNKPELTECEKLLKWASTIVVLDHHRQGSKPIENAVLSYIEPYASSTCEMVAEVLQYIVDDVRISGLEANALYAGIMIDTNNFMNRTGVRTFEAAAFLRRCGADITSVRKMFRDDIDSYRAKAEVVSSAVVYRDEFAIAKGENPNVDSPTIIGAQAANELLNIGNIKASFVLTKYNGKIYVSARSIDEVNVQIIMERMGGGGHMNTAGAQFEHTNMQEAIDTLKATIDLMLEEGDI